MSKELLAITNNNRKVWIDNETRAHMEAHSDVNMESVVKEAISKMVFKDPFTIEMVDMGRVVGTDNCVETKNSFLAYRKGREGMTPLTKEPARETTIVTVGMCRDDDGRVTLFTAFYGVKAPKEPWDKSLKPEEREESEKFWATHALNVPDEAIDWEKTEKEMKKAEKTAILTGKTICDLFGGSFGDSMIIHEWISDNGNVHLWFYGGELSSAEIDKKDIVDIFPELAGDCYTELCYRITDDAVAYIKNAINEGKEKKCQ